MGDEVSGLVLTAVLLTFNICFDVGSKFGKGSFEELSGTGISVPSLSRHRQRDRKSFARDLVSRDLCPPVHQF